MYRIECHCASWAVDHLRFWLQKEYLEISSCVSILEMLERSTTACFEIHGNVTNLDLNRHPLSSSLAGLAQVISWVSGDV